MKFSIYRLVQFTIKKNRFALLFFLSFYINVLQVAAQDTLKSQTIQIVSSYKPVLKPSTKFGFSASPMPPAPFSDKFIYTLPDQQYKVLMRSVELVPATFTPDSLRLHDQHFLKIGYGNFQRIYAEAGTSWGAGKPLQLQLFAGHHSLKGNQFFQQNSRTYAQASVQYFFDNHILQLKANAHQNNYYYFGNEALTANDKKDSLRITFNQWSVEMGVKNQKPNRYGLNYDPSVRFHILDAERSNEINALLRLPLSVRINQQTSFTLYTKADLSRFRIYNDTAYQNQIISVTPSVLFPVKDFTFDLGVQAAWDNGTLNMLPQLGMEVFVKNNKAVIVAGARSKIQKNNFHSLIQLNPWLGAQRFQLNTRMDEYFAGIRGTLPVSFSYRLTGGITNMYQLPLFLNIPKTSLFTVLHEERIQTFHLKASAEWLPSDKISADMGLDLYQILKQKEEKKAWHFIPMQFNVGARWKPTGDLTLQTKMYIWDGPYVKIDDQSNSRKLPAVFDASIEADFRISKLFLLWLQMNNIFNQQYQRWNQYPVVGFQLIGGIRLNFEQKK